MPNVTSAPVEAVVEAIGTSLGSFAPESVVPDVEGLLENHHKIYEALTENLKKLAARLDDELPVHSDVAEGLREMIPALNTLGDQANEVYSTFKSRHEQELRQHYEPRANEKAWNT
jgi:phosphoglycolate phosphatase-like HAD superfamily hydrolase